MSDDFAVLTVVSPLSEGGEEKNQDRTAWDAATASGCVCDGTTSSPDSDKAASLGVELSPVLFRGHPEDRQDVEARLRVLADALVVRRLATRNRPLALSPSIPAEARAFVLAATREKWAISHQTTLVAAHFLDVENTISTTVVRCGDSSFWAFAPDGTLLTASPAVSPAGGESPPAPAAPGRIRFGPGDEILVKVMGKGPAWPALVRRAHLEAAHAKHWLVGQPLDQCRRGPEPEATRASKDASFLGPEDRLLIPLYLVGHEVGTLQKGYCRVRFSRTVRVILSKPAGPPSPSAPARTNVTCVLPDHFYTGDWVHFQERFPAKAEFVLASDGFADAFDHPVTAWKWLHAHRPVLTDPTRQTRLLHDLHAQLAARRGDDDISFLWICAHGDTHARG